MERRLEGGQAKLEERLQRSIVGGQEKLMTEVRELIKS